MRRVVLSLFVLFLASPALHAHGLLAHWNLQGERIVVEVYFDDDTAAPQARVKVVDGQQQLVAEGTTDEAGKWSFPRPAGGQYRLTVTTPDGHRKSIDLAIPAPGQENAAAKPKDPPREEATRVPWLQLAVGVAIIAGLAGLALGWSRGRKPRQEEPTS